MSKISKKHREKNFWIMGDHKKYISRITKTLYYSKLPKIDNLSLPVTELAAELFSESQHGKSLNRLHCDNAAKITRNTCISPCSLVLALLYLEKLKKSDPKYVEKTAPSDLFLVSLMVSCKFLYDDGESDDIYIDEWAKSAGIKTTQLVQIEKNFLKAIKWEVYVSNIKFWKKLIEIETSVALKEGNSRGFFTYTELNNLLDSIDIQNLIRILSTFFFLLMMSYVAYIFTIIGSMFITSHIPGTCITLKENYQQNQGLPKVYQLEMNCNTIIESENENLTKVILNSIQYCNETNELKKQIVSWNWWTIPSMVWLSETSDFIENFQISLIINYLFNFMETSNNNFKYLNLEDKLHKATKTRIQNQMENSWHAEWTDIIINGFNYKQDLNHLTKNIRS